MPGEGVILRRISAAVPRIWRCGQLFGFFVVCFVLSQPLPGEVKPLRRVLIVNEVGTSYPLTTLVDEGIRSAVANSPYRIEFYREYMESILFPDAADQQRNREFYIQKYQNHRPDIIITVGPSPLKLMVETHRKNFAGIPIVFCVPNAVPEDVRLDSDFTGVEGDVSAVATVATALRLQPDTEHVIVVGGVSDFDRQQQAAIKRQLEPYEGHLDITYLTNLSMPDLQERLKVVPSHSIVLLSPIGKDAAGTLFTSNVSAPMIVAAANAPIFSLSDRFFGHGEVGGDLSSALEQGKVVGRIALQLLQGAKPQDIPRSKSATSYMFDTQALHRWGLKERDLPLGSVLYNKQPTAWESYKWYFVAAISLIILEAVLIGGMIWQRAGRRVAERNLGIAYDRLRMAFDTGHAVGWDWDIKSGRARRFGDLENVYGFPPNASIGHIDDFRRALHEEDRDRIWKGINEAMQTRQPYNAEFRIIRSDGMVRWLTARGQFYYSRNGNPQHMVGMALDITERKKAEDALTGLTGRLIKAQEEERRRIAREIHDDYNQRLAMLAIDLEKLGESLRSISKEGAEQTHELFNGVSEIGADLHSLSHSLHSSTLENLGLVAGVRAFCREFSEQQDIEIDFVQGSLPSGISQDAALCMFRIAQEALRNVKRHSGTNRAEVRLEYISGNLLLSVTDRGRGFDPNAPAPDRGIGIRSMEERLRLLGGRLEVQSRPMKGTRIDAWLPYNVAAQHAS